MVPALRSYPPFRSPGVSVAAPPDHYKLTDLGVDDDGMPFLPLAVNNLGDLCLVVHARKPAGLFRGFAVRGGQRLAVGLALGQSPVTALSSTGEIAGATGSHAAALRAWSTSRGSFGERFWPGAVSTCRGINGRGQIVGNVLFDSGEKKLSRAFLLPADGEPRFLIAPAGGTTVATALNDSGDVAFNAIMLGADPDDTCAWCLHDECYIPLEHLGGGHTWATAITPGGRIVGHSRTSAGETHAFLWEDGDLLDLGTPAGCLSQAFAANDGRIVVGRVFDEVHGARAFRWTPDEGIELLSRHVLAPSGWELHEAVSINRRGDIVGTGSLHGQPRGFLLKPVV